MFNVSPFPLGKYWSTLPNGLALGGEYEFKDLNYSVKPNTFYSESIVVARLMQNNSAGAVLPGELLFVDLAAPLTKVDGKCDDASTGEDKIPAGTVDPWVASAGVPDQYYFFLIVHGPGKVKQPAASAPSVTAGQSLVPHATENGRADVFTESATEVHETRRIFGWAIDANDSVEDALYRAFIQSPRFKR